MALSPALVVFAFTGVPGDQAGVGDILYWHRVNLIILFVGGVLWAATAIAYHRRSRNACVSCGRVDGEEKEWTTRSLAPLAGKVGAFEGALYEPTGYYRPQADCIMFTRDEVPFCHVCQRAIERVIDLYTRPAP